MSRFVVLLITITAIAGILWVGAWFTAASVIKSKAGQFMQASLATPYEVQCESFAVGGFPLRFDATCDNLVIYGNDITLSLPEIKLTVLVYRPTLALFSATGPAQITDAFSGSRRQIRWDNLRVSVRTNGWALAGLFVEADNLELIDNIVGEKLIARVGRFKARLLDDAKNYNKPGALAQLAAFMRADKVTLGEFDLADANLRLTASIDAIPDDFRRWSPATIAGNWFSGKTGIDLLTFSGNDARSEFELSGRLSATEQGRLSGNFGLDTQNIAERLQPVIDATMLQVLFGFPAKDGSRYQSYTLRYGVLLAGNLPILTFDSLI